MKYTEINIRPYEIHMMVLDAIKSDASVLELGCATGYFSKELKKRGCYVVGTDIEEKSVKLAKEYCDEVFVADLESTDTIRLGKKRFDYVLLMDVIEHISHREALLEAIRSWLEAEGKLILTTPNIAHISARFNLLRGDFTYAKWGIMDETHVHFFTKKTLIELLKQQGYKIERITGSADFGQLPIVGRFARHIPKSFQFYLTQWWPTLFAVQWLVVATK